MAPHSNVIVMTSDEEIQIARHCRRLMRCDVHHIVFSAIPLMSKTDIW